jgi:hypothetical protein
VTFFQEKIGMIVSGFFLMRFSTSIVYLHTNLKWFVSYLPEAANAATRYNFEPLVLSSL